MNIQRKYLFRNDAYNIASCNDKNYTTTTDVRNNDFLFS